MFGPIPTYDPFTDTLPLAQNAARNGLPVGPRNNNNNNNNMDNMPDLSDDPNFENTNRAALLAWQERQRRQRTLRMLTMFLMILLLMDGEEPPHSRQHPNNRHPNNRNNRHNHLRNSRHDKSSSSRSSHLESLGYLDEDGNLINPLKPQVYNSRLAQDESIRNISRENRESRYHELITKNGGKDVEEELRVYVGRKMEEEAARGMVLGSLDGDSVDVNADADADVDVDADEEGVGLRRSSSKGDDVNNGKKDGNDVAPVDGANGRRQKSRMAKEIHDHKSEMKKEERQIMTSEEKMKEMDDLTVFHYPRNATGYYRGLWVRSPRNATTSTSSNKGGDDITTTGQQKSKPAGSDKDVASSENFSEQRNVTKEEVHTWAQTQLYQRKQDVGILFLPPNMYLEPDVDMTSFSEHNSTSEDKEDGRHGKEERTKQRTLRQKSSVSSSSSSSSSSSANNNHHEPSTSSLSLTKDAGRAAFQLYSRPIPAMSELSIVDGLVKLYDGMTTSFVSRRTDVLLRVRGVMINGCGKMSLVTSSSSTGGGSASSGAGGASSGAGGGGEMERRRTFLGVRQIHNNDDADGDLKSGEFHSEDMKPTGMSEDEDEEETADQRRRRRLRSTVGQLNMVHSKGLLEEVDAIMAQIRHDVMDIYSSHYVHDIDALENDAKFKQSKMEDEGWSLLQSVDEGWSHGDEEDILGDEDILGNDARHHRKLEEMDDDPVDSNRTAMADPVPTNATVPANYIDNITEMISWRRSTMTLSPTLYEHRSPTPPRYVYPYPYVIDDADDSITKATSPATRNLPNREKVLEANAGHCEFEINIDVHATQWTYGEWRASMEHRLRMGVGVFNPYWNIAQSAKLKQSQYLLVMKSQLDFLEEQQPPKEALVMTMTGDIASDNCDFRSFVNVTAMRTNWEHTTAKAINYSFYMMLTCLTQIVILLRQLLHTQSQSVATNVSLICIGWQTVLDAIMCISHIFLCLVMQPLFTAFASVAFFKLLIFCVIEMKYMAIILQARNNANNTNLTQEDLRRQVTLLHLKFYGALMFAIVSFWYMGQTNRTLYIILLYSFWVPQIILNIITESRKPMHPYYMYGMSLTRSVAPMYVFAVRNNFLKEVNPDFPTEPKMCQLLILWIAIQTAILFGQSKYGTRFMIPQRFLPPKFDYSRPIPSSLLPRPAVGSNAPSNGASSEIEMRPLMNGDVSPSLERSTNGVARNRRGGGVNRTRLDSRPEDSTTGVRTTISMSEDTGDTPTLDCVICYNEIDVNDRQGYMLAPCDHIFHRRCLEQWMDIKMECPICRCNLPSL